VTDYNFEKARKEWERIPDDRDYFRPEEWLELTDQELQARMSVMEHDRYRSWRNHEGKWRALLGLDSTHHKTVLDFGCGTGIESLQFAKLSNRVIVADINPASVSLARRVLRVFGYETVGQRLIEGEYPFVQPHRPIDVFYANGVLHHTPHAQAILHRAAELLAPGGEVRLMLYSDRGWRVATHGQEPPAGDPREDAFYPKFLRFFDSVGDYAEPWWEEKLAKAARPVLELESWDYFTPDGRYAAARLRAS
jgi:SAM-dependent methyltransferase